MPMPEVRRPTEWTDPKTGKRYVLKKREEGDPRRCEGCVGNANHILCAHLPPCVGPEWVWTEAEAAAKEP